MKNIKLIVEYDGSNFSGWQRQIGQRTVEEELNKALNRATGEEIKIIAAGRTDKKVHAKGQVVNFKTVAGIPGENYQELMDFLLPEDISIKESCQVDDEFHSRFDATRRKYRYLVYRRSLPNALVRNFTYHFPYYLNIDHMRYAAEELIGTHDFTSFKTVDDGDEHINMERTINFIGIYERDNNILDIVIEGNSFLHNMVRIMVGTLLYIGTGKIDKEDIKHILAGKDRALAGVTVAPQGLYLEKVYY